MRKPDIRELYYITHRDNLPSILELGILSHDSIQAKGVEFTPVYDEEIVSGRQLKSTPDSNSPLVLCQSLLPASQSNDVSHCP